jgi:hypothetical protein
MAQAALHRRRDQWESSGSESDHSSRSRSRCGSTTVSPGAVVSISDTVEDKDEEEQLSPAELAEKQKKAQEFAMRRKQHYNMGALLRKPANPLSRAAASSDTSLLDDDDE